MQIKMRAVWIERLQESLLKPAVPGDAAGTGSGPFPLADAAASLTGKHNMKRYRVVK